MPNLYAYRATMRTWLGADAPESSGGREFSGRAGTRGSRAATSPSDRRAGWEAS
jgi:hypothetical protein